MRSRDIASVAVFAALYAVGSLLPGFPIIGVEGGSISLTRALEVVYGLLLGPIYGPVAAFLGSFVGKALTGGGVGFLTTPLAAISAFIAACLGRKRAFGLPGWALGAGVLAATIASWYLTTTGLSVPYYPTMHIASLLLVLVLRERIADMVHSKKGKTVTLGVAVTALPSTLAGHILGGVIFIALLGTPAVVYVATLPVAVVERSILTLIAAAVGGPLLILVRRAYPWFEKP